MSVEVVLTARPRDIGADFPLSRVLPAPTRRMVGPFIFFDHMGPGDLPPGRGFDVRPHPHVGLATVTWLFEGEIVHRDSLGFEQPIRPGELNWMIAGRGIVHSERSPAEARVNGAHMEGLQLWVALPDEHEDTEPAFHHHPADTLPHIHRPGAHLRLIAGQAYGAVSPAHVHSPLFYVDARLEKDTRLALPDEYSERAAYVVTGSIVHDEVTYLPGTMVIFGAGEPTAITAAEPDVDATASSTSASVACAT